MGSPIDDPHYFDNMEAEVANSSGDTTKAKEKPSTVEIKPKKSKGSNPVDDPEYFAKQEASITGEKPVAKEEKPVADKVEQFINKTVDKIASFSPIKSKPEVPTAPDSADTLLQFAKGKTAQEFINSGGQEALGGLSPAEIKKFSDTRQDVILPPEIFNKKYEADRSAPIMPTREDFAKVGEGLKETAKGLATGAYHIGKDLLSTDPESNAKLWNDVKSYVSPVFETPMEVGWTVAKVKAGGSRISDLIAEKMGQNPETSRQNAYQRHIVDAAKSQADEASKNNIYSQYLTSPTAVAGMKAIMRLNSPNADDSVLQLQAEQLAKSLADEQKPLDTAVKELGMFTLPRGTGMGEFGVAMNIAPFTKGVLAATGKLLPKSIQEARIAAQQLSNEAKLAREVESAGKVSTMGRIAGATADTIENLQGAGERFAEANPSLAKIGSAVAKYGPGAYVGYEADKENPLLGAVLGAGIEKVGLEGFAALKTGEALRNLPRVAADVAEARAASAGGRIGAFKGAGMREESSELTRKLFGGDRGAKLDKIAQNLADYGREGVNMTALGLATGAINSANADQMRDMVENGLIYGFLGKTVHKVLGTDPVEAARKSHQQDVDNHQTVMNLSPETRNNLRPFTEWGTVVEQARHNLDKTRQMGGDTGGAETVLKQVSSANLATREAYRREVLNSLTAAHQLVNGALRTGQPNIGIELLTTKQIFDRLAQQNPNKPAAELQAMADSSKGIYFPSSAREAIPGAALPEALKASGVDTVFNPLKPTVVVNMNKVVDFASAHGKSLNEAMSHELGHAIQDIPEFRDLNKDVYSKLFDTEFKGPDGKVYYSTKGLYSDKDLNKLFFDNYLSGDEFSSKEEKEAWADSRGLMRDGKPDEAKIANYMKDEVMADLNGTAFHLNRVDKLDSGRQHLLDWAAVEQQNNILARTVHKLMGFGGDGKLGSEPKAFTGAQFSPEILATHREAIRAMQKLNGMVSTPTRGEVAKAAVSRAQMIKSKALRERYGRDSGLFKTEFKATIFDKDGNAVGTTTVRDPMTKEGTWGEEGGNLVQRSGYGDVPQEIANVQIPSGGTVKVSREIMMAPDGETPLMLSAKEAQLLSNTRDQLIRNAIDGTDDVGTPGRFQPFSADGLSYSGTFTPKQIEAIKALPENIVPAKIKDTIMRFNELISKGEGHRMLIDYAARLDERGKYKAFSPKIYDVVPIGMGFSKAGNFYVTAVSATRLLNKLELWADRMPSRLSPWGGDREAFFREFADKYLPNHLAGKPGETGLSKDPEIALQKKNIFNDFLNLTRNDAAMNNPDRTTVPRKKGERKKDFDPDRTIMAIRADAVAEMLESTATPLPIDYGKQLQNFLPAGEGGKSSTREELERTIETSRARAAELRKSGQHNDAMDEEYDARQAEIELRKLDNPEGPQEPPTQQNLPGFLPSRQQAVSEEERIKEATYTNPRTGEVSTGETHLDANPKAPQEATDRESPAYGFYTTKGRIVDRNEAFQIAQAAGQLKEPTTEEEKFHADRGVLHSGMYEPIQRISSAGTSIRQVPAVFKAIKWNEGTLNADIGGGKYDDFTNALQTQGVENVIYDPYNRSAEHNQAAMDRISGNADTATISNVLNVIAEPAARDQVIRQAADAIKPDGEAYFSVYIGDGSGKGKETPRGYQLNKKLADYVEEIERHFGSVTKKGNILIAKEPIKAGASDISFMPAGDTKSPKFKEWFGDSQVVDEEGKPRVMYHGTDREFNKFQKNTTFFAFEPEFADQFANRAASGWQTYSEEAYDPYKTKEDYESDLEKEPNQKQTPVIVPVYVRAENIFDANNAEHMKKIGLAEGMIRDFQQLEAYKSKMEKAGFDAYYDYEYGTEEDKTGIFTFSPEQVKSATGNTGEYSKETADIRFLPAQKKMGININDSEQDFTGQILSGQKTIETRDNPRSLAPYVGQRIGLVSTGRKDRPATLVGTAVVGEPIQYNNEAEFRADQDKHLVEPASTYDIKENGKKWGFPLTDVQPLDPQPVESKGIVSRGVNFLAAGKKKGDKQPVSLGLDILQGKETTEGLPKKPTVFQIAQWFQDNFNEPIDYKSASPEQKKRLTDSLVAEIQHAYELHPEAAGWYDENISLAMNVMRELDPDLEKPENDFVFKALLAVTSDGNPVDLQFDQSWKEYQHWKKTGKFSGEYVSGTRVGNIRKNVEAIGHVIDKLGKQGAVEWLTKQGTVSELKKSVVNDLGWTPKEAAGIASGELQQSVVPYAAIFGPKLGSFFNNLYGDFSTTTMDRWFMRTIGRLTGSQVSQISEKELTASRDRVRNAVSSLSKEEQKKFGVKPTDVKGTKPDEIVKKLSRYFSLAENRKNLSSAANELRKSVNDHAKTLEPIVEAPENGSHRQWIRSVIEDVQKQLKDQGINLENADLQALLWYGEKELYEKLGYRTRSKSNDYASAAASVYQSATGRPSGVYAGGTGQVGGIGRSTEPMELGGKNEQP